MEQMTDRFLEAVKLARDLHAQQRRKGEDTPYLSHLLRVAGMVMGYDADEDTIMAALLHDAIEDQGGVKTAALIRKQFGDRVEKYVMDCSDSFEDVGTKKRPWRERKESFIAKIENMHPESLLIVACDKLDNLRSSISSYRKHGEKLWAIFAGGRDGTLWYYREVGKALREEGNCPLIDDLEEALAALERLIAANEQ